MPGLNDYNYDGRFALSHVFHLRLVITTYPYVRTESCNLIRILTLRKAKSKVPLCNKFSRAACCVCGENNISQDKAETAKFNGNRANKSQDEQYSAVIIALENLITNINKTHNSFNLISEIYEAANKQTSWQTLKLKIFCGI